MYLIGIGAPLKISGIPEIPSYPIVGNLFQVRLNPSLTYSKWSKKYGDVFQIRLGNSRVVVANSFESAKELWVKNACSNNSRPVLYTFHKVVSTTQGFTIGSTPMSDTYKKKKKVVSTALNKRSVDGYGELFDYESTDILLRIFREVVDSDRENPDLDLMRYIQLFTLRSSIFVTYGYHVDYDKRDKFLADEIIFVENKIINLRSHTSNLQDFIPLLRFNPFGKSSEAKDLRARRDWYMNFLLDHLELRLQQGEDVQCLAAKVLKREDFCKEVTKSELQSICLTMVSAGLDNTPLNFNHCVGHLSQQQYGYKVQEIAYREIVKTYNGNPYEAWCSSPYELKCDYVIALLRESLRFFTVMPLSLPRETTKDIYFKGALIPAHTTLLLNAFEANHDPKRFEEPFSFKPERFLGKDNKLLSSPEYGLHNFSFGAGARICAGNHLAFKEMYTLLIRSILLFKIRSPKDPSFLMGLDPFENNMHPAATGFEPKTFKVQLEIRDNNLIEQLNFS